MQSIHQNMGISDCSSPNNIPFIFPLPPSSSQIPLIMHHQHHPSSWTPPPVPFHHNHTFNRVLPYPTEDHEPPFNLPLQPPTPPSTDHYLGLQKIQHGSDPFGIHPKTGNMTIVQEIVDAKAVAASKNHSEAERRRRERINNHLTRLRSLLPSTTKTDKASLLAEVIQHVKDLKRQNSIIAEQSLVIPTEIDELTLVNIWDEEGRIVIKASLCCEDRSDLLPDLIKTLKMLRLRTLKAEFSTLGRRVKNVLFVTGEEDHSSSNDNEQKVNQWINNIEEALKAVVGKNDNEDYSSVGSVKRQRTYNIDLF